MQKLLRIGTRESQLALWQATRVLDLLKASGQAAELVLIKSEGDIDLTTPLYEMGVQGIFTRSLDIALLNHKIDLAVHSMKDVPIQLAEGISQAAVLKRGSYKDILVYKGELPAVQNSLALPANNSIKGRNPFVVATSSIRRKAQWLHRYPDHQIETLRGNVNTRLKKLDQNPWNAAIFAAAGLERIGLRPDQSIDLDWMLPAPAQGAILVVSRTDDQDAWDACQPLNDPATELCTRIERDFLRQLLGGCSTPISALAEIEDGEVYFRGNILTTDGRQMVEVERVLPVEKASTIGRDAALELLANGGKEITETILHAGK